MLRIVLNIFLLYSSVICDNTDYYDMQGWKEASDFLKTGLKRNINPCENFFEFSCGKWNEWKGEGSQDDNFTNTKILTSIQNIQLSSEETPKHAKRLGNFFDKCLKSNSTLTERLQQVVGVMIRLIGRPPILSRSDLNNKLPRNVWNFQGKYQREFVSGTPFIALPTLVSREDNQDEFEYILRLSPARYSFQFNSTNLNGLIKWFVKLSNDTLNWEESENHTRNVVNFEEDLGKLLKKAEEVEGLGPPEMQNQTSAGVEEGKQNSTLEHLKLAVSEGNDETIRLSELKKLNPKIQWDEFFQGLFSSDQFSAWNKSDPRLIIDEVSFFKDLDVLTEKYDIGTIFNYVFLKTLVHFDELTEAIEPDTDMRKMQCMQKAFAVFPAATAKVLFDDNQWDITEWRTDVEMIGETVFAAFKFLVQESDWLDRQEKMNIITKLNYISFYSGIPDWLTNDTVVDRHTPEYDSSRELYDNYFTMLKQLYDIELNKVAFKNDVEEEDPGFEVNAFYGGMKINVLLGQVLPPMFHKDYPLSVKYGIVGWTFGHELFHAFDANHVDEIPPTVDFLLKDKSILPFNQKKHCLIKQYASFCYKQEKNCVHGERTLSENMADIDGLKIAYMAYKFAMQTIGGEPPLVSELFDYTGDQIFFLAAARSYCGSEKNLEVFLSDDPDEHSPNRARVEISFRNFQAFAKSFKCPVGSPLAPLKTCSVWGNFYSPLKFL